MPVVAVNEPPLNAASNHQDPEQPPVIDEDVINQNSQSNPPISNKSSVTSDSSSIHSEQNDENPDINHEEKDPEVIIMEQSIVNKNEYDPEMPPVQEQPNASEVSISQNVPKIVDDEPAKSESDSDSDDLMPDDDKIEASKI